ncbi:MAG: hypothetical protein AB1724_10885 [Thermodesulfobacteriota bacterium]
MIKKIFVYLLMYSAFCFCENASCATINADDFLPPVQAKTPEEHAKRITVNQPQSVTIEKDQLTSQKAVTASTAQDAINTVVQKRETGCKMIKFPSGFGWVACGQSSYREMNNSTATRISKRNAYLKAFMQSKTSLAESLNGLSNSGKDKIRQTLSTINTETESLATSKDDSQETLEQTVQMLLRGFVVYEVFDDTANNSVWVSIVTTPKTQGKYKRPDVNSLQADTISDGLNAVLVEIQNGLVPPIGGKIVTVDQTGEIAFVGFGSAVVQAHQNSTMQNKLNLQAERNASLRAKDALCGLILGDDTSWRGKLDEQTKESIEDFEELKAKDVASSPDPVEYKKFDQTKQTFINKIKSSDEWGSIRQGILPPGVTSKSWMDDDNAIAYAVSVYLPSVSAQAEKTAKEMHENTIINPDTSQSAVDGGENTQSGFLDENDPNIDRPKTEIKQGPSGKVQKDEDL